MSGGSIALLCGAIPAAAAAVSIAREGPKTRASFVLVCLLIGLALCACIQAGRDW